MPAIIDDLWHVKSLFMPICLIQHVSLAHNNHKDLHIKISLLPHLPLPLRKLLLPSLPLWPGYTWPATQSCFDPLVRSRYGEQHLFFLAPTGAQFVQLMSLEARCSMYLSNLFSTRSASPQWRSCWRTLVTGWQCWSRSQAPGCRPASSWPRPR